MGHWDGDYTFVIDTTGVDDRTWLDEAGHPHTVDAHVQERYTRVDQYNYGVDGHGRRSKVLYQAFQFLKATYLLDG